MRRRLALSSVLLLSLAACRAEKVQITLTGEDLKAAAADQTRMVPFRAVFSQPGGLDEEAREKLVGVEAAARKQMAITTFTTEDRGEEWVVIVEGTLPLQPPDTSSPWALRVQPAPRGTVMLEPWALALSFEYMAGWDALSTAISAVDGELVPDPSQPVTLEITAGTVPMDFLILAADTGGETVLVKEEKQPATLSVTYGSDLYQTFPPTLYFRFAE